MVAFLTKTEGNDDFADIVDFLNASSIRYSLTVNPTVYVSYIKQFWSTAKTKTANNETQIYAKVAGKSVVVTESSVRSDLHFNDEDGATCLTTVEIFENLALMGYERDSDKLSFEKALFSPHWKYLIHTILHCLSSKSTAWNEFSTNVASTVICLAKGQKFNFSKLIFDVVAESTTGPQPSPQPEPTTAEYTEFDGVRYIVHSRNERRTTQNSGICSPGPDGEMYYGQLQEILEFKYYVVQSLGCFELSGLPSNKDIKSNMSADVAWSHGDDGGGEDPLPPTKYQRFAGLLANRGKGKKNPNLGGRAAGRLNTSDKTHNLSLKEITDKKGPVPIRFKLRDKQTLMPLGDYATQFDLRPHMESPDWTEINAGI
ncbi:hypothetical protein Tco_1517748 [Tanacetum coccineum]